MAGSAWSAKEQGAVANLLEAWSGRVSQQASQLELVVADALALDADITRFSREAHDLQRDLEDAEARQGVIDAMAQQIWEPQVALGELLDGLEESLQLAPGGSERPDDRAQAVEAQLEELSRQVQRLAEESAQFRPMTYAQPLARVAHVLDAHSSELDAVEQRLEAAERQLGGLFSVRM